MNQAALVLTSQFENLKKLEAFSVAFLRLANQKPGGNNVVLTSKDALNLHTLMFDLFQGHNDIIHQFIMPPKAKELQ